MSLDERVPVVALLALYFVLAGCSEPQLPPEVSGDPERGKLLLRQYGCGSCHKIPGVATARGNVGPPLDAIANRVYLAGVIPNTPQNMARWIQVPQEIDPRTAMPNLQVSEGHAQDMVAYLYRLR
jgi:cytochrome c551/c552